MRLLDFGPPASSATTSDVGFASDSRPESMSELEPQPERPQFVETAPPVANELIDTATPARSDDAAPAVSGSPVRVPADVVFCSARPRCTDVLDGRGVLGNFLSQSRN